MPFLKLIDHLASKNRNLTLRALLCLSMALAVAEAKRGAVTLPACVRAIWAAKGRQDFDGFGEANAY